jgi:xylulokinase
VGEEEALRISGTLPFAGFMAPTLLWMKKNDPRRLEKARGCVLPKDWLRCRMTGELAAEETDGASTSLFDIRSRRWSDEIIEKLGLDRRLFPDVLPPAAVAGTLLAKPAQELGLPEGTPVTAGCADQVAQAVGNGLFDPGTGSVTLGSGGQILVPMDSPDTAGMRGLHVFCHAPPDRWYVLGALMTAGLSLRWLRDLLGLPEGGDSFARLSSMAGDVEPGGEGLLFLPYLTGERAPVLDSEASGCFLGLTIRHGRGHLARAVMEGVAFAFRHVLETMMEAGVKADRMLAAGGGLADPQWRRIVADVLGVPLLLTRESEQASVGAALIAALGTGVYRNFRELGALYAGRSGECIVTEPDENLRNLYGDRYRAYLSGYPSLRDIMHRIGRRP